MLTLEVQLVRPKTGSNLCVLMTVDLVTRHAQLEFAHSICDREFPGWYICDVREVAPIAPGDDEV